MKAPSENHETLFRLISEGNTKDFFEILAKTDVSRVRTAEGYNICHYTALFGTPQVMAELLGSPYSFLADEVVLVNGQEKSPLHLAVEKNDLAMTEILLSHGLDPNRKDDMGYTVLHYFLSRQILGMASPVPMLNLLLRHGADAEKAVTVHDETPLVLAARHHVHEAVAFFLDAGADPDHRNIHGETALHKAVRNSDIKSVEILLARGADLNIQDNNGSSVLHYAAQHNYRKMVETLLDAGANPFIKDSKGRMPDKCCLGAMQQAVRMLITQKQAALIREHGKENIDHGLVFRAKKASSKPWKNGRY